jgi:hypothetical protein
MLLMLFRILAGQHFGALGLDTSLPRVSPGLFGLLFVLLGFLYGLHFGALSLDTGLQPLVLQLFSDGCPASRDLGAHGW